MNGRYRPPVPRDGHTLVVGIVARISGCANQKEVSLDDQVDHAKQAVAETYDGPVEYRVIQTTGKGEALDRPELAEIEELLRSGELDLLVAEDLGRIVRGSDVNRLCGLAVDHGTRVLSPNDGIDTADPTWEEDVLSACRDHVGHNAHTSKRLKHKLMNRFAKSGGALPLPVFGYVKPAGARTLDDLRKDPAAGPILAEWFRRLRESPNCTAVADWLNAEGVPTGPYCRRGSWDGAMVRRLTRNPLLKGLAARGFKHTVKRNETGRRVSVRNPDGPLYRACPHLAHVDPDLWDEVNERLDAAHKGCGRKPVGGADPLLRVPRKRTRFPGQHARCHYCGRRYVWGGNGVTENLMCGGAREWRCWNSIGFPGATAAKGVVAAVFAALDGAEGLDDQLRAFAEEARREAVGDGAVDRSRLAAERSEVDRQVVNLTDAIAQLGPVPELRGKLEALEARRVELARRGRELERRIGKPPELPGSIAELRRLFVERAGELAVDSPEFGDVLRELAPEFRVHLVRSLDGGHPRPRARVRLRLAGLVPDAARAPAYARALEREVEIGLFEPTQREAIRAGAARLAAAGLDQRQIAARLGVTQPAVQRALSLDREMRRRGLDSPYEVLAGPPEGYPKLRRHESPKYRFEPEPGYAPPAP